MEFQVNVRFAKLPCLALIGMDIINEGKLDMDGLLKVMTFTRH